MNRSVLIKLVVVLLVVVLVHSVFWFFKTGQLAKHVNNFISENSSNVSAAEVKVVGYPFSQKVIIRDLKFTLPNAAFGKYQIIVKSLEAKAGIFASDFTVEIMDKVSVQDVDNNIGSVEFNQNPLISFSIAEGIIAHFSYSDTGYRVFDADKNIIYSAASSTVNLQSTIDSNDQITSKLTVAVKDIEGFDVIDIYRNSSEKKIIDGIKTGEISLGGGTAVAVDASGNPVVAASVASSAVVPAVSGATASTQQANTAPSAPTIAQNNAASPTVPAAAVKTGVATTPAVAINAATTTNSTATTDAAPAASATAAATPAANAQASAANNAVTAPAPATAPSDANTASMAAASTDKASDKAMTIDVASVVAKNDVVKNNLMIDIEYILTPTKNEQQATVPLDPSQIQESATQYNRVVKVNNIELSNSLYKISLNGQVNYFQDDNMPSGFITVRVENLDKLTSYISTNFNQLAEQKQMISDVKSADLSLQPSQTQNAAYQDFLKKIASRVDDVAKELSAKSQLSKDNIAVFDMRREKNLEFIVNETPLREIVGKF
jgi:hypothetical protein